MHEATATESMVDSFASMGVLNRGYTVEGIKRMVADGGRLWIAESSFTDIGEDFSILYVDDKIVGFMAGH